MKGSVKEKERSCYSESKVIKEPENKVRPDYNPVYQGMKCRVYMIKENTVGKPIPINSPDAAYYLVKDELINSDREMMLSILLTGYNTLIGVETICIGSVQVCSFKTADIFKGALLANAVSVVLCHNHPSGSLEPSFEDIKITKLIKQAGDLIGIRLLDHLIVSHEGYKSIID